MNFVMTASTYALPCHHQNNKYSIFFTRYNETYAIVGKNLILL